MNNYFSAPVGVAPTFSPVSIALVIIVILLLFLIIREIVCWYWKINKIVDLLEKIEDNTRPQIQKVVTPAVNQSPSKPLDK